MNICLNLAIMAGIYLHIPFCKQQCSYCDFHFSTTFEKYRGRMVEAIRKEVRDRSSYLDEKSINTIYFGGGTPSILNKNELTSLLETIYEEFNVEPNTEITLEANPDDCTRENLEVWKSSGINRLSIGLQSFRDEDLKWMNRAHSAKEAKECVSLARSFGFENMTVDLIYGLPNLSEDEWRDHIQTVIKMGVPHISAYCLTVEPQTVLSNWVDKGKIVAPGDDEQSDQFLQLLTLLEEDGYQQYEISNFSKEGYESKHNSNYWKGESYLGVGPSAHSFNGVSRQWNFSNNARYMQMVEAGKVYFEVEQLTEADQFNESVLIGLRTMYGVNLNTLKLSDSHQIEFEKKCAEFIEKGWMTKSSNKLILSREGKLRADYIASELFIDSESI